MGVQNSNYDIREIQAALSKQYILEKEWSLPGVHLFRSDGFPEAGRLST